MIKNYSPAFWSFAAIFIAVFALSLYLKLIPVLNYNFPFTMDQARDMLDLRAIVELKKPALIGPTTSINGVFLGPFYYYFNLIPYIISGGDPNALVYWNIAWYMIGAIVLVLFFYKQDKIFGLISSIIFLMAPANFYSARYFWNANLMPYITVFYFLSLFSFFRNQNLFMSVIIGLISGLSMQVEAAFGILFFPFFFIVALIKRIHFKFILISTAAFLTTLIPQVVFELRHNFVMSQTFLKEVSGQSQTLGEKLTFSDVFLSHIDSFIYFSTLIFQISPLLETSLLVIAFVYLLRKLLLKKLGPLEKSIFLLSAFFVLYAFVFYLFYYYPLKGWFLLGLRVPYIFIIALFLTGLFKLKLRIPIFKILVVVFLIWSIYATYLDQLRFILADGEHSADKSNLRNEIEVIDWVYQKAEGRGFKAYNYIPSVYDFPYQYLYWWHGTKKHGYQPEVVTYLNNVPEYIQNNDRFFNARKKSEDGSIFLIYEHDERQIRLDAWLGDFTKYCTIEKKVFSWGTTTAESRRPCTAN